jgi:hypothetical protein
VTNLRTSVLSPLLALIAASFVALIAASGCEKTNDVPHLRNEALAVKADYEQRFDELRHRTEGIARHARSLPPDTTNGGDAQQAYRKALGQLEEYRNYLQLLSTRIQAGVTNGSPEELPKLLSEMREHLEDGVVKTTAELTAVESWVWTAEQRPSAPSPSSPPPSAAGTVPEGSPPLDPSSDAPIR